MPSSILPDVYGPFGADTVAFSNDIYFCGLTTWLTKSKMSVAYATTRQAPYLLVAYTTDVRLDLFKTYVWPH
jgi:hypothetical protein